MARRRPQVCKVDENHAQIVEELRALGLSVTSLAKVANGCPDIVVGCEGMNFLFELKMPGKQLNEAEEKWRQTWRGQVNKATSSREVLELMEEHLERMGKKLPLRAVGHLLL